MSMQYPLADMFIRICNAQTRSKEEVSCSSSKLKVAVAHSLEKEGYICGYSVVGENQKTITIKLKYYKGVPVIEKIKCVSLPSLRAYVSYNKIPKSNGGLGVTVMSTNKGVMSDVEARKLKIGGEVLCTVF